MNVPLDVPRGGAFFEGHFPGRPILPGVALLDLVLRAIDPRRGPERLLCLEVLRLRRVVLPGERLEIEAHAADARLRWTARRGEEIVAQASLILGSFAPVGGPAALPARIAAPAPPAPASRDLDGLLPHRPPMRFVTAIEAVRDDRVVCTARLAEGGPFAVEGFAPALVAIEVAAQAAAVFAGLRASEAPASSAGYLVGARDVRFRRGRLPADAVLTAAVRAAGTAAALSAFDFDVACQGESVASGTLSTWLTPTGA